MGKTDGKFVDAIRHLVCDKVHAFQYLLRQALFLIAGQRWQVLMGKVFETSVFVSYGIFMKSHQFCQYHSISKQVFVGSVHFLR